MLSFDLVSFYNMLSSSSPEDAQCAFNQPSICVKASF